MTEAEWVDIQDRFSNSVDDPETAALIVEVERLRADLQHARTTALNLFADSVLGHDWGGVVYDAAEAWDMRIVHSASDGWQVEEALVAWYSAMHTAKATVAGQDVTG